VLWKNSGVSAICGKTSNGKHFCPLGDRDRFFQVDVLDRIQKLDALGHRALERLASRDESGAARALVDDGGEDCIFKVLLTRCATAVDKPGAAHVAIRDLVAAEIDRVVGGEFGVDAFVEFAVA
jgi:hypothetical protein